LIAIKAAITATGEHYIGLKAMTPNYRQRMTATLRRKEFVQLVLWQKWLFVFSSASQVMDKLYPANTAVEQDQSGWMM